MKLQKIEGNSIMTTPTTKGDIPFTPEAVIEHLDMLIEFWRNQRKRKTVDKGSEDELVALCYVDAFQSIRKNLFGEVKE